MSALSPLYISARNHDAPEVITSWHFTHFNSAFRHSILSIPRTYQVIIRDDIVLFFSTSVSEFHMKEPAMYMPSKDLKQWSNWVAILAFKNINIFKQMPINYSIPKLTFWWLPMSYISGSLDTWTLELIPHQRPMYLWLAETFP